MINLPSGRKAELIFKKYLTGTHVVYIDLADGDTDRVAKISKGWQSDNDNIVWLPAFVNLCWQQLTQADMADCQEIVRLAFEQAKLLDEDFVPGKQLE